jgi:NADPH:quinone reductase-like Zn-dependent oxidoreductase
LAVQLARWRGAHVIATTSTGNLEFVRMLGANEVIDYRTTRFEDLVCEVDVVFDTVGGETLTRSFGVLKAGGKMVTVATQSANAVVTLVEQQIERGQHAVESGGQFARSWNDERQRQFADALTGAHEALGDAGAVRLAVAHPFKLAQRRQLHLRPARIRAMNGFAIMS